MGNREKQFAVSMRPISSDLAASTTPITKYLVFVVFLLEIKRLLYYHGRCVVIVIVNTQFSVLGQSPKSSANLYSGKALLIICVLNKQCQQCSRIHNQTLAQWGNATIPHNSPQVFSHLVYKYCMNNEANIPDGSAMPDGRAKKISEVLNNKPISPENELADALEDMALDIASIEPNPQDWGGWIIYVLEQIQVESRGEGKQE